MTDQNISQLSPKERLVAAIKVVEEFEQTIAAIRAEHSQLVNQTVKAGEAQAVERLKKDILNLFETN
jgi:hypothetical protein